MNNTMVDYKLESYRKGVELLAKEKSTAIDYNQDREHAMIVLENLLNYAEKDVNIFTGSFNTQVCNYSGRFIQSLERFLIRGGKLNVILNDYKAGDEETNSTLRKLRSYARDPYYTNKIAIKTTTQKPKNNNGDEIHFAVADSKAFREEYDTKKFAARFSFDRTEESKKLNSQFNDIFNNPTTLPLKLA